MDRSGNVSRISDGYCLSGSGGWMHVLSGVLKRVCWC